ncbi:hypothetical protein BHE74_00024249 [Ensete ventricosum]|nr:hypothetical protein BHE74_00024249 [Ensete ventricosum]
MLATAVVKGIARDYNDICWLQRRRQWLGILAIEEEDDSRDISKGNWSERHQWCGWRRNNGERTVATGSCGCSRGLEMAALGRGRRGGGVGIGQRGGGAIRSSITKVTERGDLLAGKQQWWQGKEAVGAWEEGSEDSVDGATGSNITKMGATTATTEEEAGCDWRDNRARMGRNCSKVAGTMMTTTMAKGAMEMMNSSNESAKECCYDIN